MSKDTYQFGHETYWGEIDVTVERQAAWSQWVEDYVVSTATTWVEQGATQAEVMQAAAAVLMDWQQIDSLPWMPLGPALVESMDVVLAPRGPELEGTRRLDFQRAQRTIQTATEHDRMIAASYQLGVDPGTGERLLREVGRASGAGRKSKRTALYRHFDAEGVLIYVGITDSMPKRTDQHRRNSAWFQFVADTTTEMFDTRTAASNAEREAIKTEGPVFNDTHNKARRDASVAYLFKALARRDQERAS